MIFPSLGENSDSGLLLTGVNIQDAFYSGVPSVPVMVARTAGTVEDTSKYVCLPSAKLVGSW